MASEKRLDLIDRKALLGTLERYVTPMSGESGIGYLSGLATAMDEIEVAPAVDAVKVVHARWINKDGDILCSHCGSIRNIRKGYELMVVCNDEWVSVDKTNYCPDCGAAMDADKKGVAEIDDIKTEIVNLRLNGMKGTPRHCDELSALIDRIEEQPSVDAAPVVHGRWIEIDMCACRKCSVCDFVVSDDACSDLYYDWHRAPKYCPECGAKMEGGYR